MTELREEFLRVGTTDDPDLDRKFGEAVVDSVLAAAAVLVDAGHPADRVTRAEFAKDPTLVYVRVRLGREPEDEVFVFRTCMVMVGSEVYLASSWLPSGLAQLPEPVQQPKASPAPN